MFITLSVRLNSAQVSTLNKLTTPRPHYYSNLAEAAQTSPLNTMTLRCVEIHQSSQVKFYSSVDAADI